MFLAITNARVIGLYTSVVDCLKGAKGLEQYQIWEVAPNSSSADLYESFDKSTQAKSFDQSMTDIITENLLH